jgi:hypothetical protein
MEQNWKIHFLPSVDSSVMIAAVKALWRKAMSAIFWIGLVATPFVAFAARRKQPARRVDDDVFSTSTWSQRWSDPSTVAEEAHRMTAPAKKAPARKAPAKKTAAKKTAAKKAPAKKAAAKKTAAKRAPAKKTTAAKKTAAKKTAAKKAPARKTAAKKASS